MPTFKELMNGLGPTVLTSIVCFIALLLWVNRRRWTKVHRIHRSRPSEPEGVLPYALGLGFLIGYIALDSDHAIPLKPTESVDWLFWGAAGMLLLCVVNHLIHLARWTWYAVSLALIGLTLCAVVTKLPDSQWTGEGKLLWWGGSWAAALVLDLGLDWYFRRRSGLAAGSALTVVSVLFSLELAMSAAQTYGMIAAIIPATLIPLLLLTGLFRTPLFSPTAVPLYVLLFGSLVLCGYLFIDGWKAIHAAVFFASPLGLLIGQIPVFQRLKNWQRSALEFLCVVVPSGIVFGLTLHKFLIDMANYSAY